MKPELQKELKEKVRPGIKPSQLKRSRSLGDIPKAPLPKLTKSKSAEELESPETREELETKISTLELKLEVSQREIDELKTEKALFKEQLKEKQKEVEKLRERLETKASDQALDQALNKRHQNLKDWFKAYQKTKQLDKELTENINEASEELLSQDQKINYLQSQNFKLKQEKQSLQKDLQLTQRLAEMRKKPFLESTWPVLPEWGLSLISLALTVVALWILFRNYDL